MSVFQGYIRDRLQFNQYTAELLIQSGFWIIRYKDVHGNAQQITWEEKKIVVKKENTYLTEYHPGDKSQFYFTSDDPSLMKRMHPKTVMHRWLNNNPAIPVIAAVSSLLVLGFIGLWFTLPFINNKIGNAISIETESKLGDQMIKAMLENEVVSDTLSNLVNEYYTTLQKESKYKIKISVVHSDIVNAFALPGGNIVIYSGILKKLNSHEALAALLGHESTHIEHRHSLKSLTRNLAFSAVVGIIFSGNDLSSILASNASKFSGLKYSRSLEEDADQGSIQLMNEKKISMAGMVDLMTALNETDSAGLHLEFIQTHPLTEKRLAVAKLAMNNQVSVTENHQLHKIWIAIQNQLNQLDNTK